MTIEKLSKKAKREFQKKNCPGCLFLSYKPDYNCHYTGSPLRIENGKCMCREGHRDSWFKKNKVNSQLLVDTEPKTSKVWTQGEVDQWNKDNPVGTQVELIKYGGKSITKTRSRARFVRWPEIYGDFAGVQLEGILNWHDLENIKPSLINTEIPNDNYGYGLLFNDCTITDTTKHWNSHIHANKFIEIETNVNSQCFYLQILDNTSDTVFFKPYPLHEYRVDKVYYIIHNTGG
jgi:hypothetical protein